MGTVATCGNTSRARTAADFCCIRYAFGMCLRVNACERVVDDTLITSDASGGVRVWARSNGRLMRTWRRGTVDDAAE
jgi:hypothetical protein